MALDEGDKAICGDIAQEIIEKVIKWHIDSCPHGIKLGKAWMLVLGASVGSAVGGGGIVAIILKAFM